MVWEHRPGAHPARFATDSPLEGDGFELPVREHRDSRMCTHLVVTHRVAVHVPVLICRLRPGGANNSKLELLLGQASPTLAIGYLAKIASIRLNALSTG